MNSYTLCSAGRRESAISLRSCITYILFALTFFLILFIQRGEAQSFTLLYPNGGEVFVGNSIVNVRWNATGFEGNEDVEVEYSLDGGGKWRRIGRTQAAAGMISWQVPDKPSTTVSARVITRDGAYSDESDNLFEIKEDPLSVTLMKSPNGGEVWKEGEVHPIGWQVPVDAVNVTLQLSTDLGVTWSEIATVAATPSIYNWMVPHLSDQEIATGLMKIIITEAPDHFDQSDAPFTIAPKQVVVNPKLTLLYPNGGEVFAGDSTITITWQSENASGQVEVQYTTDGGVNWQKIDRLDVAAGSLRWKVPTNPTANGAIRTIMVDGSMEDRSDAPFAITERRLEPITLITPNGGETWKEGETGTIRWQAPGDVGEALIDYSADGGATWNALTRMQANISQYAWTIPHIADSAVATMIVRITDAKSPTRFVESASTFTIVPIPQISNVVEGTLRGEANLLVVNSASSSSKEMRIVWHQKVAGKGIIHLYNIAGEIIAWTETSSSEAGEHRASMVLEGVPAGMMFFTLRVGEFVRTGRVVIER